MYLREEGGAVGLEIVPAELESARLSRRDYALEPLVQVKLAGDDYPYGFAQGRTMRWGETVQRMEYTGQQVLREGTATQIVTTLQDLRGYRYRHICRLHDGCESVDMWVEFDNNTGMPAVLEMLSSFTLGGVTPFEDGLCENTLVLHRMRSTWSCEGRLDSRPVEELQLEPSWKCYSANTLRFGQLGSMPVRQWAPFAAVEDVKRKVVWAAATTHASSWQMEAWRRDNALVLSGGIADREFGHWTKTVPPGGHFAAPPAVVTVVCGGVDEAAERLAESVCPHLDVPESERELPILFNEFCTSWGVPTEESVKQAVDVLCGRGVGYFVIDAGWYDDEAFEAASRLGRWLPSDRAFPNGLAPVVEHIHQKGMKAGLWFEFEVAGRDEVSCFEKIDWLLCRDGVPITSGDRRFWDFRKPEVVEYLAEKVIGRLRSDGFDYIKVDYNETIGLGCDGADSPGDGLYNHILAVQAFFARIKAELPHMVIEVCSSGGHRLVRSFMGLASMASFSDAHA